MREPCVRSQYRIRKDLDDWLNQRAEKNHRSKNGELNKILEQAKKAERINS